MRGTRRLRWACLFATLLLLGPITGIAQGQEKKFIAPVSGEVIREFDAPSERWSAGHRGIDYAMPVGSPVRASAAGTVSFAGRVAEGLYVTVDHAGGIQTTYSFLSRVDVNKGESVSANQVLGLTGAGHPGSGKTALHFGAKQNDEYIDPRLLLADLNDITDLLSLNRFPNAGSGDPSALSHSGHAAFGNVRSPGQDAPGGPGESGLEPPAFGSVDDLNPPMPKSTVLDPGAIAPNTVHPQIRVDVEGLTTKGGVPGGNQTIPGLGDFKAGLNLPEHMLWRQLPEDLRAELLIENREQLAQYAGLTSAERDALNRDLLEARYRELVRYRNSEAGRNEVRSHQAWTIVRSFLSPISVVSEFDRESAIDRKIRSAKALLDELEKADESGTRAYLLEFDVDFANGDGKAVVALGDPDTAEHIGVLVPGINNGLGSIGGPLDDVSALRSAAADIDRPVAERTSTIVWMGYDNPNGLQDASNQGEANDAAPHLKRFVNSLRTRHVDGPSAPHITVFGHSYGSVVTGIAALNGMRADDVVFFGSPGVGRFAVNVTDFLQDRVWVAVAKGDPIQMAAGTLGSDPTLEGFGARKVPLASDQRGHSSYFALRSLGLRNFAKILIGRKVESE